MVRKPHFTRQGIRHATVNGHRLHLRLTDPSEDNFLWIDGRSPPLVLDQVAAEFVGHLIDAMWQFQQGEGDQSERVRRHVVEAMFKQYGNRFAVGRKRVTRNRIRADLDRLFGTLMAVAKGGCPVEAGLDAKELDVANWAAPARMDLAVTYRCNLKCSHCYVGDAAVADELTRADWLRVYERLWQIGVPQIVFTGGEPTQRDDLVDLVAEADEFVTGLVTNGTRLEELAGPLRGASLDYMQVTLESAQPDVHNRMVGGEGWDAFGKTVAGIRKALELGMQVTTNTTLTRETAAGFAALLRFGKELGLAAMSCNTLICSGRGKAARRDAGLGTDQLRTTLEEATRVAAEVGIDLAWYSPTCYLHLNPIELGLGAKGCSAAAHNMTVQPDGTVLPCQSWPEAVGHILHDDWSAIWNHPTCRKLRSHGFADERDGCRDCVHNAVCGGGCPLEPEPSSAPAGAGEGEP